MKKLECMAAIYLTGNIRWSDAGEDQTKFKTTQPRVSSADGMFTCVDEGNEAQDYFACASLVNGVNIAMTSETAQVAVSKVSIETTKTESLAEVDPNNPTAMLEAQKKIMDEATNLALYKATNKAAIAAVIATYAGLKNNTKEEFLEMCYANLKGAGKDKAINACDNMANKINIAPNAEMAEKAQAYALSKGIESATAAGEWALQSGAADRLGNAINRLKDQMNGTADENEGFIQGDLQANPCIQNPNLEQCGGKVSLGRSQGAINTGVNIDGGDRGIGTPTSLTADLPGDATAKKIDNNELGNPNAEDRIAAVNSPRARNNGLESSLPGQGQRQELLVAAAVAAVAAVALQELEAVAAEIKRPVLVVEMVTNELIVSEVKVTALDLAVEMKVLGTTVATTEEIHLED